MRMPCEPPPIAGLQQKSCSAATRKGSPVLAHTKRIPRCDHTQSLLVTDAMDLVETKGELADGRPDVLPLIALQRIDARDKLRVRAKGDNVLDEDMSRPLIVNGSY